jgi:hypothetical protein
MSTSKAESSTDGSPMPQAGEAPVVLPAEPERFVFEEFDAPTSAVPSPEPKTDKNPFVWLKLEAPAPLPRPARSNVILPGARDLKPFNARGFTWNARVEALDDTNQEFVGILEYEDGCVERFTGPDAGALFLTCVNFGNQSPRPKKRA